jgi:hypothetical protein
MSGVEVERAGIVTSNALQGMNHMAPTQQGHQLCAATFVRSPCISMLETKPE